MFAERILCMEQRPMTLAMLDRYLQVERRGDGFRDSRARRYPSFPCAEVADPQGGRVSGEVSVAGDGHGGFDT